MDLYSVLIIVAGATIGYILGVRNIGKPPLYWFLGLITGMVSQ